MRLASLILAIALCVWSQFGQGQVPGPPNVILVLIDDMGWSDVGAFGGEIETPHIDRLAAGGLRFTQFHTTAKCFPSRAALLTGRYPEQVGMDESPTGVIRDSITIAQALGAAGYRTLMVGKHHGGDHPLDLGFERFAGLRGGASNHFNPGVAARPGEPEPARKTYMAPKGRWWCFDRQCVQGYAPQRKDFHTTDAYTDWVLDLLTEQARDPSPFFLYLAYQAPHDPLQAWPADIERYLERYEAGYAAVADARYRRMLETGLIDARYPRSTPTYRDWTSLALDEQREQARRMAVYAAMIDHVDRSLGRLIAHLERSGKLDQTLILFTSDNGASAEFVPAATGEGEIGEHHPIGSVGRWATLGGDWANVANTPFRHYKNHPFEGGAASPLIAHWPDGIREPGRVVSANAHLIDLFPTLLSVTGARKTGAAAGLLAESPRLEGIDLSAYFQSSDPIERPQPVFQRWGLGRSVRTDRWKLLSQATARESSLQLFLRWRAQQAEASEPSKPPATPPVEHGDWQLYDMSADRTETTDVAKRHPQVVARLTAAYDDWLKRVKPDSE
ncbi:MAG: sulfatase-like hydrolase/transferase [Gammaproteobacteria bacterium]|nr:sulfatase-like hydrolase/transferase [Gammaproteobacteria bacterium]